MLQLFGEGHVCESAVGVEEHEGARVGAVGSGPQEAHARSDPDPVGEQQRALRACAEAERAVRSVDLEPRPDGETCDAGAEPLVRADGEHDPRTILGTRRVRERMLGEAGPLVAEPQPRELPRLDRMPTAVFMSVWTPNPESSRAKWCTGMRMGVEPLRRSGVGGCRRSPCSGAGALGE